MLEVEPTTVQPTERLEVVKMFLWPKNLHHLTSIISQKPSKKEPWLLLNHTHTHTHTQLFYGPFYGTTRVSRCQKRTSGLYGAKEDQQRQTHRPSGWVHSIQTNQCPPPLPPIFYRPDAIPAAQPTVSKH